MTVEGLEARIKELEDRLEALRWTEQDAIEVVQYRIVERLSDCQAYGGRDADTFGSGCNFRIDPVLKYGGRGIFGKPLVEALLKQGEWSAIYEPHPHRWRVAASGGEVNPLVFHVYEKTGVVEGVAPDAPAEETR